MGKAMDADMMVTAVPREQAEAVLLNAAALQRAIVNSASFSTIATDTSGVIQIFNAGAERMLGYAATEVINKITPADISDPQELVARASALSRELETTVAPGFQTLVFKAARGIEDIYELTYIRKDGSRFPAVVSVTALRDAKDAIIGYLLIATDNTARKQAAFEQLELDNRKLAVLNEELTAFSYSVSHDLRAPLRSIDGFSQVLLEDYADKLDDEGRDSLHRVREASQRMGQLIDDMLKLSRATRGELEFVPVDLSAIAKSTVAELARSAPRHSVTVSIEPGVSALSDGRLLRTVLENLFSNAWKFTAKTAAPCVEFAAAKKDGELVCRVRDNGAGFDMAHADNLFVPFQRLHQASEFPGNGIGLATVKRVITRLGGRVWADGAVGKGATVYFALPNVSAHKG